MGTRPGIGFKTNVTDESLAQNIIKSITEHFDNITQEYSGKLTVKDWDISYRILNGTDEYYGLSNEGLTFSHSSYKWPNWAVYTKRGKIICEINTFIKNEYPSVDVEEVYPITPTS